MATSRLYRSLEKNSRWSIPMAHGMVWYLFERDLMWFTELPNKGMFFL